MAGARRLPRVQRVVQALSLGLFLLLLWQSVWPFAGRLAQLLHPDLFLRLDPAGQVPTVLAAREWLPGSLGLVLLLLVTPLVGRLFCGWLCPLGTTVDLSDRLLRGPGTRARRPDPDASFWARLRGVKHGLLLFLLGAALLGVSLVFFLAPISLVTRFYALLLQPLLLALGDQTLGFLRPTADALGLTGLYYTQVLVPRFATQSYVALFFALVLGAAFLAPRFWCRYLCPSGAMFALLGSKPLLRRRVSSACTECGRCARQCPMGAIPGDPHATRHGECIVCQGCVQVCPEGAVSFGIGERVPGRAAVAPPVLASRRGFLLAGAAGAGTALMSFTGLYSPQVAAGLGHVGPQNVLRPPGALPEAAFLAKCLRCGLCMRACPTNTLQPIGWEYGLSGLFSPTLFPRRGACEPTCRACGAVCPTGALRLLPDLAEKTHAKLGTARILVSRCLAWEHKRECLVCDEVCPYDAIELRRVPESPVPVPVVHEERCAGCGFCEHHCPVREERAIVVEPQGALRLARGSYVAAAAALNLNLSLQGTRQEQDLPGAVQEWGWDPQGLPPGFSEPE